MRGLFQLQGMEVTQLGPLYCENSLKFNKYYQKFNNYYLDFQKIQCLVSLTIVRMYLRGEL